MVVVEPLRCQYRVGVLSVRLWMVCSRMSAAWARTSSWAMVPASSRSLLVMVPDGLAKDTRALTTGVGKGDLQRMGVTP